MVFWMWEPPPRRGLAKMHHRLRWPARGNLEREMFIALRAFGAISCLLSLPPPTRTQAPPPPATRMDLGPGPPRVESEQKR